MKRRDAIAAGLKVYNTGEPCKYGHIADRRCDSGCCVVCLKTRSKNWKNLNGKRVKEYSKRYNADYRNGHPDVIQKAQKRYRSAEHNKANECSKRYRDNNKDKATEYGRRWRKSHQDVVLGYTSKRGSYVKDAQPKWFEKELVNEIYNKRDSLNEQWGTNFQVDHIIPLVNDKVCGLHCWDNLQLLEATMNGAKNNNYHPDW